MNALNVILSGRDRGLWLGGADIVAVPGIPPWTAPLQLWEAKTCTGAGGVPPAFLLRAG
jgi:hypothetical protein